MKLTGKIIEVFVLDQGYHGLQVIDLKNWSGRGFLGYREQLNKIKHHEGLGGPSVYFLLSSEQDTETGNFKIYIGETEDFTNRISGHRDKSWWDKFICFTSIDGSLTKAHVKYLEKQFYDSLSAEEIDLDIENNQPPGGAKLPNSDECFLDGFADNIYFILKTMGFDYFENNKTSNLVHIDSKEINYNSDYRDYSLLNGKRFELKLAKFDASAFMRVENGKCILEKDSHICNSSKISFSTANYYKIWKDLVNSNDVEPCGIEGLLKLRNNITTEAPSKAGALAYASRINGPKYWKCTKTGKSFKELQTEIIEKAA